MSLSPSLQCKWILKVRSHQTKVKTKVKILFDVWNFSFDFFRWFFDPRFLVRFRTNINEPLQRGNISPEEENNRKGPSAMIYGYSALMLLSREVHAEVHTTLW